MVSYKFKGLVFLLILAFIMALCLGTVFASDLKSLDTSKHWIGTKAKTWIEKGVFDTMESDINSFDSSIKVSDLLNIIDKMMNKHNDWDNILPMEISTNKDEVLTRQDAAFIFTSALGLTNKYNLAANFNDASSIAYYAEDAVNAAMENGLINGYPNNTFKPEKAVTFAEVINMLDYANKTGYFNDFIDNVPKNTNITLIKKTLPLGEQVIAVAIKYSKEIDSSKLTKSTFTVEANYEGNTAKRTITKVYTNSVPDISSESQEGSYVIIELSQSDANSSTFFYDLSTNKNFKYKLLYYITQVEDIYTNDGDTIKADNKKYKAANEVNYTVDKFEKQSYKATNDKTINYRFYKPNVKEGEKYPLVLFLHGNGERGYNNELHLMANKGGVVFAEIQDKHPAFILAPQLYTNGWWHDEEVYNVVMELLNKILQEYPIDTNRIYMTGISKGGFGTWFYTMKNPNLFAAAMPVCGGAQIDGIEALKDMPIWAFHAADDPVVNVETISKDDKGNTIVAGSRLLVDALKKAGSTVIKYTEYEKGYVAPPLAPMAHFSWVPAYNNMDALEWLFSQDKSKR